MCPWTILTQDAPLIGMSDRSPDGVENVMIIRTDDVWTMIYSEGLAEQHLAYAQSSDRIHWTLCGGPANCPTRFLEVRTAADPDRTSTETVTAAEREANACFGEPIPLTPTPRPQKSPLSSDRNLPPHRLQRQAASLRHIPAYIQS